MKIDYLESNNIITKNQSGFRAKHSCTTAILKLTEEFHQHIANGKCIILVLLDFSNAFESVDHDKLIQVLKSVGVTDNTFQWYKSFLSGWNQTVKSGNEQSCPLPINSVMSLILE